MRRRTRKAASAALSIALAAAMTLSAQPLVAQARESGDNIAISELPGTTSVEKSYDESFLSVTGYAADGVSDRSCYYEEYIAYNELKKALFVANGGKEEDYVMQNTENYMVANNEQEFCDAVAALPKVIEVAADLNLGWKYLDAQGITHDKIGEQGDYSRDHYPITSPDLMEDGVSKLDLTNVHGLTIYSQKGNTIRHCELQFTNCSDIVVRNLSLQCANEWDDYPTEENRYNEDGTKMDVSGTGERKRYDWDIITVYQSTGVWIDHCTCGIAYDGTIDMSDAIEASITWTEIGVLDEYGEEEMKNNIQYMEDLYQQGKGYVGYSAMRDAGASQEQIYRFAAINDKVLGWSSGPINYDVNIYDKATLAYCYVKDSAQRVPQLVSGNAHMFNCWVDCMNYMDACADISAARTALSNAGIFSFGLCRANSARGGATLGTDTCVFEGVINPIIGSEYMGDEGATYGSMNHNLIVNSSTQKYGSDEVYIGSSWDNNGENAFVSGSYWIDKKSINNFTWALWKDLTKDKSKASDTVIYLPESEATSLAWGEFAERYYIGSEELGYDYQIVPLEEVTDTLTSYAGADKVELTPQEWLSTEYSTEESTGHKVTFQFDGNGQTAVTMEDVADGATVEIPEVTEEKTGYTFSGWYTKEYALDEKGELTYTEVPFTAETPITDDTTVYAKWEINTYTLTLELNGGTSSESLTKEYEYGTFLTAAKVTPSDLAREGYVFSNWYTDSELKTRFYNGIVTDDMTLYAKWTKDKTSVRYGDVNDNNDIEAADALAVLRYVVGLDTLTDTQKTAANVDGKDEINANDALCILQKIVGLIDKFPVEE